MKSSIHLFLFNFRDIPTWQSIRCALDEASKNVPHFENGKRVLEELIVTSKSIYC